MDSMNCTYNSTEIEFNKWLYEACNIRSRFGRLNDAQYYYERVDLLDAKLCYLDGNSPAEYAHTLMF